MHLFRCNTVYKIVSRIKSMYRDLCLWPYHVCVCLCVCVPPKSFLDVNFFFIIIFIKRIKWNWVTHANLLQFGLYSNDKYRVSCASGGLNQRWSKKKPIQFILLVTKRQLSFFVHAFFRNWTECIEHKNENCIRHFLRLRTDFKKKKTVYSQFRIFHLDFFQQQKKISLSRMAPDVNHNFHQLFYIF